MTLPEEERMVHTRAEMKDVLAEMLGGRAAEEIAFKREQVTTGAQNDLERVTTLARKMITEWGMSEKLGPITYGHPNEEPVFLGRDLARQRNYSEEVAAIIDGEVRGLVEEAYEKALTILREHWEMVTTVVVALKERETLDREAFERLVSGEPVEDVAQPQDTLAPAMPEAAKNSPSARPHDAKPEKARSLEKPQPVIGLE